LLARVEDYIESNAITGWASLSTVINGLKGAPDLRWANPLELKNAVEKAFTQQFGEKVIVSKGKVGIPRCDHSILSNLTATIAKGYCPRDFNGELFPKYIQFWEECL
jgi:hypothetical protein